MRPCPAAVQTLNHAQPGELFACIRSFLTCLEDARAQAALLERLRGKVRQQQDEDLGRREEEGGTLEC